MNEEEKYNRQVLWFGSDGQAKLAGLKIAIVGIGGTGSHVLQQLVYLGVKNFIFIDSDKVSETNLNRLIGANDQDVGQLKVDIAKRLVEFINSDAKVVSIPDTFISEVGLASLKEADFIFGCVDKDGARLLLTEFCKAYQKPYLDIATEINGDDWGGRIIFTDTERGCLICRKKLSQEEIHRDLSSPEDRSVDDKIYGVDKDYLGNTGPSVVSLNGVLSSLAVSEFLNHVTGIRSPKRNLEYRGKMGIVTNADRTDEIEKDCYYCDSVVSIGDKVDMERHIRQGINKFLR